MTGFTYVVGSGTSAEQSFTVSGANLTTNISIAASTNYEISKTAGTGYATPLTFTPAEAATAQTVYVRLKAGLAVGSYNGEDITATSTGADNKTVTCSGSVTTPPPAGYLVNFEGAAEVKAAYASGTVNLSGLDWDMTEAVIGNLAADFFNGTKSARFNGKANSSMTMLADKTTGLGTLSFPYRSYGTDAQVAWKVEYSSNAGSTWSQIGADFTATTAVQTFSETVNVAGNVRIKISLVTNSGTANKRLNIDDISLTDYAGGSTPTINVTGTLSAFSTYTGTPSAAQTYTVGGSNLTANIAIAAVTGFEYSTDGTNYSSTLSLTPTSGTVATTTIYVRLTGAAAGTPSGNIAHTSAGATQVDVAVSGTVTAPTPTITLSPADLNAFSAYVGTPSAPQTYTVAGVYLTADISIAAVSGFEYSTNGTSFSSTLSLAHTAGTVTTTTIYVRLTGTTLGDYSGTIVHTSTGATQQDKAVTGSVTAAPSATTFLEENFVYTAGSTLVSNGWVAHSGVGTLPPTVANQNLSYTNYPPNAGLSGQTLGNGEDVHRNFAAQTAGVVYSSFLINVTSATTTDAYLYHYATDAELGTDFKARLFVGKDASDNLRFGLSKASGSATTSTPYEYALNTTYLVVLKYEFVDGAANDLVSAWINPVISSTEPTATLTGVASEADIGTSGVGSVAIRQSNAAVTAIFDGIRVTNDWAQLWVAPLVQSLHASTTELDPLACIVDIPSQEIVSYTLYGTNLQGQIVVTAPTGFQVSVSETEGWDTSLSLAPAFNDTIYVRMLADTEGPYSGVITHTSGTATQVDVAVSGDCYPPAVNWNIVQSLVPFTATAGTPSANQSYTLGTTTATGDITVATTAPFELSTTGSSGWLTELTLPYTFNATIYVRMNASAASTYNAEITHNTAEASPASFAISGEATAPAGSYAADLFISEYTESGSGNNKALELFNGTGSSVDLSAYSMKLAINGGAWGTTLVLAGTLAHGDVYVVANAGATAGMLAVSDTTSTITYFNGDDAVGLFKNDVLIDIIGVQGVDPGSSWPVAGVANGTMDHTLIRKPTVIQGNIDWTVSAGTTEENSEWIVLTWTDNTNLGLHTFSPGMEIAATPTFSPVGGVYTTTQNVTISSATVGAAIYYTTNGDIPTELSTPYSTAIAISSDTTLKAIAVKTGYTTSAVGTANYLFPVDVANIAALRASAQGATIYRLTGEAVLTFQQTTRHQKYILDATSAILFDDPSGIITSTYALYDGITGIAGTIAIYNGLLQFTPVADPGAATSSNNVVVPEVRTFASLTSADQAKLIKVLGVTVDPTTVTFGTAAQNINVTDATATLVMRTFPTTDYSSTAIPVAPVDLVCLVGQFGTTMQVSPRFLADFEVAGGTLDTPVVVITQVGTDVVLTWEPITGAATYRVESSSDPYAADIDWTTETDADNTDETCTISASADKKFYRVIALP
ncbi:hypothetical protein MASR2M64_16790 [Candidatus Cloacimonadota bacterium]